jgi:hypothetical protein
MLARLGAARTVREMEREEELQQWRARAAPPPPPAVELDAGEVLFLRGWLGLLVDTR